MRCHRAVKTGESTKKFVAPVEALLDGPDEALDFGIRKGLAFICGRESDDTGVGLGKGRQD